VASTPGSEPAGLANGSKGSLARASDGVFCSQCQYLVRTYLPLMTHVPPVMRLGEQHLDGRIEMRYLRKVERFALLACEGARR